MFFGLRRAALRVTDNMGLAATAPETTALVGMAIHGAKALRDMFGKVGPKVSEEQLILMTFASLPSNASALLRLKQDLAVTDPEARAIILRAWNAAFVLASNAGYQESLAFFSRHRAAATALNEKT